MVFLLSLSLSLSHFIGHTQSSTVSNSSGSNPSSPSFGAENRSSLGASKDETKISKNVYLSYDGDQNSQDLYPKLEDDDQDRICSKSEVLGPPSQNGFLDALAGAATVASSSRITAHKGDTFNRKSDIVGNVSASKHTESLLSDADLLLDLNKVRCQSVER